MNAFKRIQQEQNELKEIYENCVKVNARDITQPITPEKVYFVTIKGEEEIVVKFGNNYFYAPTSFKSLIKSVMDEFMGDMDAFETELRQIKVCFAKVNIDGAKTYINTILV